MTLLPDDCEMCHEVQQDGRAVTGLAGPGAPSAPFSRLVLRTGLVDVISGLGSLVPGYTLLVPRRHLASSGELASPERQHLYAVAQLVVRQIEATFGGRVVLVEHGSSGAALRPGGACITHCHIHLFPLDRAVDPRLFVPPGSRPIDGFNALAALAQSKRNYYFCSWSSTTGYLHTDPQLPSQHARRIWARALGRADEWDWAVFPHFDNCRVTSARLRRDEERMAIGVEPSPLQETLQAYASNARWYADQTSRFPDDSTLPREMDELLAGSVGPVLDAGAGAGRDAVYLASLGRDVIALDASAPLLAHVPTQKRVVPMVGDVRALPFAGSSIGAVWCSAVLLHLGREDAQLSLREIERVLRPSGLTQLSVKVGRGRLVEPMPDDGKTVRHFFLYDLHDLSELASRAGFEVVRRWTEDEQDAGRILQRWAKILLRKSE